MKTKFLLSLAVILAASFWSVNAQKLLISEEFSSPEWQAEFLRLNPTYVLPVPGAVTSSSTSTSSNFGPLSSTELYFGKYKLAGAVEGIRSYYSQDVNYACVLGGDHNLKYSNDEYLPANFRFNNAGTSYFELPEITSADTITLHIRSGNNTKLTYIYLHQWDNTTSTWKQKNIFEAAKRDVYWATSVDEIVRYNVNSRTPVKLKLTGSGPLYCGMFQLDVSEHFSAGLKHSIDSATVIKTENASNIGTANGQYPQSAYDDFSAAITTATTVFDNDATTQTEVEDAELVLNTAITNFKTSVNDISTGFNPATINTIKQFGRKLVINKPATISIFNTVGTLVYQQDQVQVMEVPASVGKGVFIVKSGPGVQKIYLGE